MLLISLGINFLALAIFPIFSSSSYHGHAWVAERTIWAKSSHEVDLTAHFVITDSPLCETRPCNWSICRLHLGIVLCD